MTVNIKRMSAAQRRLREEAEDAEHRRTLERCECIYRGDNPSFGDLRRFYTGGLYDCEERFQPWLPGLLVRYARRHAGIPPSRFTADPCVAAAEYLSFDSSEVPSGEACAALAGVMPAINDFSIPWEKRMLYGSAYVYLGKNPEKTRTELWESGKIEMVASESVCFPGYHQDNSILNDWSAIAQQLMRLQGVTEELIQLDHRTRRQQLWWPNPSHQTVAEVIRTMNTSEKPLPGRPLLKQRP